MGSLAVMLVSRAGLSPVMVGRDAELEQLRRLAAGVSTPTIALIGGEPGIGKTRLASELIGTVPPGTTLLLGQADPGGFGHAYQLLRDLAGDQQRELAAALADGDPIRRRRTAVQLLRTLVTDGPAVIVIDDLHWVDPESLGVFEQLDDVTTGPLLLVGTYRPQELSRRHPLAEVLERLDRRRGVTHLRLQRFVPADTARFLGAVYQQVPSRRTVTALHQRTGGNPFFLEELLKAAGDAGLDKIHDQPLPWNLAEALRSQLDGLAPAQRQVVEAAAVLGARVSFDLLVAVTGLAEAEMVGALRELVDRGLLVEAEDDQFGFRHALTREAVAGEMLGRQRRLLHEAALRALLATGSPDPAAVAVHARGAGRYQEMIDAARQGAAERLAAGSAYGALTLAELALEEAPDDVDLLALAATAAWRSGYSADARQHGTRGLRAATDDRQRVAALTQLIRVAWEQGELAEMDGYTEQVRELTGTLPDGEVRARAIAAVAQSYMLRRSVPGDAVEWADRACEVAERHGLKEVRISALVEKGSALLMEPASTEQGRALLIDVAAEAEHAGAHLEAARGWHNLFWCQVGDPNALELLERMRASAERAGMAGMALGSYHSGRAWLALHEGDLDGAIAVLEQAHRIDRSMTTVDPASGMRIALHLGLSAGKDLRGRLVELYLERGNLDAAESLLAAHPPSPRWRRMAVGLSFQLACWRGEVASARQLLEKLTEQLSGSAVGPPVGSAAALHGHLAAGLAAGLPVELLRRLADQRTGYHDKTDPPDHPLRVLVAAQLAEAQGRAEEALAGYQQTLHLPELAECLDAEQTLAPGYRGTAAVGAARCLVALGRLDEARAHLTAAKRHLARWPGWRRTELAALARRLGIGSAGSIGAAGGTGEAVLTPREREVARLIAEGLTNSEIARRLVISRKTVAVHVSHILAKLEMSSRTQVAAWVTRRSGASGVARNSQSRASAAEG